MLVSYEMMNVCAGQIKTNLLHEETEQLYQRTAVSPQLCRKNMITVAYLIVKSAGFGKESRGLHYNTDYPFKKYLLPEYNIVKCSMKKEYSYNNSSPEFYKAGVSNEDLKYVLHPIRLLYFVSLLLFFLFYTGWVTWACFIISFTTWSGQAWVVSTISPSHSRRKRKREIRLFEILSRTYRYIYWTDQTIGAYQKKFDRRSFI